MFIDRNERKAFPLPTPGLQTGILIQLADLGTQETTYLGAIKKKRQIYLGFELAEDKMEDGRPMMISNTYTNIFSDKSRLVQHLESWVGPLTEDFNLDDLLGKAANITIDIPPPGQDGKRYANIKGISPLKRTETAPERYNPIVKLDLREFDGQMFDLLPKFIQDKIAKSPEYQAIFPHKASMADVTNNAPVLDKAPRQVRKVEDLDDSIPF